MDKLDVSEYQVHLGVVQFGTTATAEAQLSGDRVYLHQRIDGMIYMGSGTVFDAGLQCGKTMFEQYGREGVKKIILFQTDGEGTTTISSGMNK